MAGDCQSSSSPGQASLSLVVCVIGMILFGSVVFLASRMISKETAVQVELDVFSGRVNPTWQLSSNEGEEFLRLFQALPEAARGAIWNGLGYRGMVVTVERVTVAGFESFKCSRGIVVGRRPGSEKLFMDRNRALERWLFGTSRGRIDEEIRAVVAQELEVKPE